MKSFIKFLVVATTSACSTRVAISLTSYSHCIMSQLTEIAFLEVAASFTYNNYSKLTQIITLTCSIISWSSSSVSAGKNIGGYSFFCNKESDIRESSLSSIPETFRWSKEISAFKSEISCEYDTNWGMFCFLCGGSLLKGPSFWANLKKQVNTYTCINIATYARQIYVYLFYHLCTLLLLI